MQTARRLPVGAEVTEEGVHFRVWAPARQRVEVQLESAPGGCHSLQPEGNGYYSGLVAGLTAGARYRYKLDGGGAFPDPASRYQPDGPHGPSEVVDPSAYRWADGGWKGCSAQGQVVYEMHL
ncbi:MAG: malto-oligosyltrehalose trehalohydrolase, partial [Gemmataceae bacterium]